MPRIPTFICGGVCFLICSVTTGQSIPKNPTIQQVVGYQQYQQKQWNIKQLPTNSILYNHFSKSPKSVINVSSGQPLFDLTSNWIKLPTNSAYLLSEPPSLLQTYFEQKRSQNFLLQKQSWWKYPYKGTISSFLKDVLYTNQSFIHQ